MESNACCPGNERRSANYKANSWSYDFVQSLSSNFHDVDRLWIVKLKEEFMHSRSQVPESCKLHIIDRLTKLGLSSLFHKDIKDTLDSVSSTGGFKGDTQVTAMRFRLLRQHGYNVTADEFSGFIDEMVATDKRTCSDLIGVLELFEASHLAVYSEAILIKAKDFFYQNLIDRYQYTDDDNLAQKVAHVLRCPSHWRVSWFDVRHQIHAYEQADDASKILLELAKLNFNVTQSFLIFELKEMSRWWKNLGLVEYNKFCRDRLVESFLCATGITVEPQHALLRKCISKAGELYPGYR